MARDPRFFKLWVMLALIITAAGIPVVSRAQAQTKAPIGWEYKQIFRTRGWTQPMGKNALGLPVPGYWYEFGDWRTFEADQQLPAGTDIKAVVGQLGADGWELVSVTPISTFAGDSTNAGVGGATTEVTYWFKRPRK